MKEEFQFCFRHSVIWKVYNIYQHCLYNKNWKLSKPSALSECISQNVSLISEGQGTFTSKIFWSSKITEVNSEDKESKWEEFED